MLKASEYSLNGAQKIILFSEYHTFCINKMWILPFLMYDIQLFQLGFLSNKTEMNLKKYQ
ncbi:hypothetical protein AY608_15155 [Acinetobacter terrae]|nr:hypothetical protein AY608_15155 [Acinetobacter terrae]